MIKSFKINTNNFTEGTFVLYLKAEAGIGLGLWFNFSLLKPSVYITLKKSKHSLQLPEK
jgi:hypothetical protein